MWSNAVNGNGFQCTPISAIHSLYCLLLWCRSPQNTWVIRWSVTVRSTLISHIRSQHYQSCTLTCHKYTVHKEKVKSKEWTRLSCVCCVQWKLFIIARDYDSLFLKLTSSSKISYFCCVKVLASLQIVRDKQG